MQQEGEKEEDEGETVEEEFTVDRFSHCITADYTRQNNKELNMRSFQIICCIFYIYIANFLNNTIKQSYIKFKMKYSMKKKLVTLGRTN